MRDGDDKEIFKQAIKEAADDWLAKQFASFGRWTAVGIGSAVFYGVVKLLSHFDYLPRG
jgi:hypothetical protein